MVKIINVAFEGIDGSGKSTQAVKLIDYINNETDKTAVLQVQPLMTDTGVLLRKYLRRKDERKMDRITLGLLFAANRSEMWEEREKLEEKGVDILISDRSLYSNVIYSNLDHTWFNYVEQYSPKPDLTLILDLDPKIAITRCKGDEATYEKIEVLERASKQYKKLGDDFDGNFTLMEITEEMKEEDVHEFIKHVLKNNGII